MYNVAMINLKPENKTLVMGVLNITPDSFSDGGLYFGDIQKAVVRAQEMVSQGADIIDVGGESTRPGSDFVSVEEELGRVIPVIEKIREELGGDVVISIDTNKAEVARKALQAGATIVNSLGGFSFDKNLVSVVKEFNCPIILYHIRQTPKTMQQGQISYEDVVRDIATFFDNQIEFGIKSGLSKNQFIIDPGIGFGKTIENNIELIKGIKNFSRFEVPILIGVSRKSHLGALLKEKLRLSEVPGPEDRLEASLAETAVAVLNGANIIRTHDVLETKKFLVILDELRK
jgi:dihydropteroate synthase